MLGRGSRGTRTVDRMNQRSNGADGRKCNCDCDVCLCSPPPRPMPFPALASMHSTPDYLNRHHRRKKVARNSLAPAARGSDRAGSRNPPLAFIPSFESSNRDPPLGHCLFINTRQQASLAGQFTCDFLGNSCEKNEPCSGGEQYRSYIGGATNGDGGVHPGDKKGGRALREKRQLRATRRGRRIEIGRKEGGRKGGRGGHPLPCHAIALLSMA